MKIKTKQIDFRKRKLLFIDLETTGLILEKHEIIEVGCLLVDSTNFNILDEYEAKVKPEHIETASSESLKVNGYSQKEWESARPLKDVLAELNKIARDAMIVSWHLKTRGQLMKFLKN